MKSRSLSIAVIVAVSLALPVRAAESLSPCGWDAA